MKLEIGREYNVTMNKPVPVERCIMIVDDTYGDFFSIRFLNESGGYITINYYTQKMIDNLVNKGSWTIESRKSKIVLDEDLFRIKS